MIAAMSPARPRRVQRFVHLLAAGLLFAYIHGPLDINLRDVVRFAIFPALGRTGMEMWEAARIGWMMRRLRGFASLLYDTGNDRKE